MSDGRAAWGRRSDRGTADRASRSVGWRSSPGAGAELGYGGATGALAPLSGPRVWMGSPVSERRGFPVASPGLLHATPHTKRNNCFTTYMPSYQYHQLSI